jgi:hypothetical protein
MEIVKPMPFNEAVKRLGRKSVIGSKLTSSEWADLPVQLRDSAFFSATIENTRFLQRTKDMLGDYLTGAVEEITKPDGAVVTALKAGSRAQFVETVRRHAIAEGLGDLVPEGKRGGLQDITSQKRLELIFDIRTQAAHMHANWRQGMDADILDEFPGQRFIREADVKLERPLHTQNEGVVRLKTDLAFWQSMNSPNIGGFGVPWGPWGFNSGMGVEDVDRAEVEALGLLEPDEPVEPVDLAFTEELKASTRGLAPELIEKIRTDLGDKVIFEGDTVRWIKPVSPQVKPAVPVPRPERPATPSVKLDTDALDNLVAEYDAADLAGKDAIKQRALSLLEVAEADRREVSLTMKTRKRPTKETAKEGAQLVSRFVHPDLIENLKITVRHTQETRAFYNGGSIHLPPGTSVSTAVHEIMHGVELQNPGVKDKSAAFLLRRASGEKLRSLTELMGFGWITTNERAFKDKWVERGGTVYSGKPYPINSNPTSPDHIFATEILTTGMERLIEDPLDFYKMDRDYFEFVVNTVRYL